MENKTTRSQEELELQERLRRSIYDLCAELEVPPAMAGEVLLNVVANICVNTSYDPAMAMIKATNLLIHFAGQYMAKHQNKSVQDMGAMLINLASMLDESDKNDMKMISMLVNAKLN